MDTKGTNKAPDKGTKEAKVTVDKDTITVDAYSFKIEQNHQPRSLPGTGTFLVHVSNDTEILIDEGRDTESTHRLNEKTYALYKDVVASITVKAMRSDPAPTEIKYAKL